MTSTNSRFVKPTPPPRWYLSLRSPYSWLAMYDADTRYNELWRQSELRVFFEPDLASRSALAERGVEFPYVPMSRAKHLYILGDVSRLARERHLVPTWPVDVNPVWEVPSLALLSALTTSPEQGRALARCLTAARWEEGRDICCREVVADCARSVGLSASLADSSDNVSSREQGVDALVELSRDGVFGVPFIVVGRQGFWGIDRLAAATAAHELAQCTDRQLLGGDRFDPVEADHAGGCG